MNGTLLAVWSETIEGVWGPLWANEAAPADLFSELYREVAQALTPNPAAERLAEIVSDELLARSTFLSLQAPDFKGESALVRFLERAFLTCEDLGGDPLSNDFFVSLEAMFTRFSLRYDLRRPCTICPTLSGIFASLVTSLKSATQLDAHLAELWVTLRMPSETYAQ